MAKKSHRRTKPVRSKRLPDLLALAIDALALLIQDVANDPRKLKPGQLCAVLNSTPLGTVITALQLKKQRDRAGLRIGDGKTVDLMRYAAWLMANRRLTTRRPTADVSQETLDVSQHDAYVRHRDRTAARQREQTKSGQDIGELPTVVDPKRKTRAAESFRFFCEVYFHERFTLKWGDDHLKVIAKIERAVRNGGLFALAMPRGSGKTTLVECAVLWAILYGYRQFIALIGSDEDSALELLASIKTELENNDELLADFPEACFPVRALDGIAHRCKGQRYRGKRTNIGWQGKTLILPMIPGSKASGAIIRVRGITGRIRGMKHTRPDGKTVRPDFVIPDDPQTDESAKSHGQCVDRLKVLAGTVLGLAGPGKKIAGIMPCTVIRRGDMADQILDRKLHPAWGGERMRMVYEWPPAEESKQLMDEYAEIWAEELANDRGITKATAFWKKHRKKIEAGSRVGWKARFEPDECSALQHAYNLKLRDPDVFEAEYQNEPVDRSEDATLLTIEQIQEKVNGFLRAEVPQECTHITSMIDLQGELLYWVVAGWADNFTGYILDYGAWPDQKQRYFTLSSARFTLSRRYLKMGEEARWRAGLDELEEWLMSRKWRRDDGAEMTIARGLKDANYGQSTDTVYNQIRESRYRSTWSPSHGRGITASQKPMAEWQKKPGEKCGLNWRLRPSQGKRAAVPHVIYDTNFWKSFVHARLAVAIGDAGCLSLWKPSAKTEHRMIAEHLRAEKRDRVTSENTGRTVDEWTEIPGQDNHLLDGVVGAAVAASMCGCAIGAVAVAKPKKVSFAELQRQARERRLGGVA